MGEKVYGLLGRKLGHSWSAPIHAALGCADYRLIELEPEELGAFLAREDIGGLNVTIPYKKAVIPYCAELSPIAQKLQSVNVLVRREDGTLYGDNTDLFGFLYMVRRSGIDSAGKKALVLGSGLGGFAEALDVVCEVPYSDIPGFPVSTVPGHAGKFIFGHLDGVPVVCMQGRIHYYEGYELSDVVLPARLMHLLGAEILFLTNASGGVNPEFDAGDFMLMTDHIMLFFPNPLVGPNIEELGTRFPDMSHVYDPELCEVIRSVAKEAGIALREGVYCQLTGPCFETPAEVRMLGVLGADAVGMSTAVEATAARHCGMRVCGISCVCNKGAGLSPTPLTHEEVQAAADAAAPLFKRLVKESIVKMCR